MNFLQPVQILQTGMKFMFDLDPTITEQLYHHSLSQVTLIAALSAQLLKTVSSRIPRQTVRSFDPLRLLATARHHLLR
jgi:hypothetical protein